MKKPKHARGKIKPFAGRSGTAGDRPPAMVEMYRDFLVPLAEPVEDTEEDVFRDLFENANDLMQSVDSDGRFIRVNRKWRETLGYSADEARTLKLTDVLREDQVPHCMGMFEQVCRGESVEHVRTVFVAKDGREIEVEGSASARIKDGELIATRGVFRVITE